MYHDFYALKYDPFTGALDSDFLFLSPRHHAALQTIMDSIEKRQGLITVLGEEGSGKTVLLRSGLEPLPHLKTLYIPYPHVSFHSLLQTMYDAFGYEARSDDPVAMVHQLRQILLAEYHQGCNVVLILDEAHNVPVQTLAQLTQLTAFEGPAGKLVQIILVGHPAFEHTLQLPALRSLTAQLARRVTLSPLTSTETLVYVRRRLAKAATQPGPIFTSTALRLLAQSARGNCRVLHTLCINALIAGSVAQQKPISARIARDVIANHTSPGTFPLVRWGFVSAAALLLCVSLAGVLQYGSPGVFATVTAFARLPRLYSREVPRQQEGPRPQEGPVAPGIWRVAQDQPDLPALAPVEPIARVLASMPSSVAPLAPKPWRPSAPAPVAPAVRMAMASAQEAPALPAPDVPQTLLPMLTSPGQSALLTDVPLQRPAPPAPQMASVPPRAAREHTRLKPVKPATPVPTAPRASTPLAPPTSSAADPTGQAVSGTPERQRAAPVITEPAVPARPLEVASSPVPGAVDRAERPDRRLGAVEPAPATGQAPTSDGARPVAMLGPEVGAEQALVPGSSQLVLETGGHTAMIRQLLFTADGRHMVSVSDDKTIRMWAVTPDGRQTSLARTIRGQLGEGRAGMLAAAALSPPDATGRQQWLAVGGLLAGGAPDCYAVRLHDVASGEVVALLPGHTEAVLALAFAPTGRWLASAGKDGTVRLWDLSALQGARLAVPPLVLTGHTDHVYDLAWSPTGDRLATASYDHTVGLWDTARLGQGLVPMLAHLRGHTHQVQTVAFHPHGAVLVSGGKDRTIRSWRAHDGAALGVLAQAAYPVADLAFAPDGRAVLAGNGSPPRPDRLTLFAYPSGETQRMFTGHQNVVLAVAFHPSGQWVASAGGEQKEILLWHAATGEVLSRLESRGRTIYAVGFAPDGQYLSWGYTASDGASRQRSVLEHRFDLTQLVRLPGGLAATTAIQAQERLGELRLVPEHGGTSDYVARLHVQHGTRRLSTIALGPADGYRHSAYTLTPDGQSVLSGGLNGVLRLYALDGTLRATLVGHTGEIKAVAVSADGQWAASGASDQTVRLWSLAALSGSGSRELRPVLSLFPTVDGEWVAWTPTGVFTASARGAQLLGYSLNQGLDKVARYVPAEQVRARLYRPELILATLSDEGRPCHPSLCVGGAR